jgi:hypothetical protein
MCTNKRRRKFNLRLTGFGAKEGETEKELVQWFNTEVLLTARKKCCVGSVKKWLLKN